MNGSPGWMKMNSWGKEILSPNLRFCIVGKAPSPLVSSTYACCIASEKPGMSWGFAVRY